MTKPLHENLNLKADYSTEELIETTKILIEKSNFYHLQLAPNDTSMVLFKLTKADVMSKTPTGYKVLEKTHPHLKYTPTSLKKSLLSYPLTLMGFSGYLNPLAVKFFNHAAQFSDCIAFFGFINFGFRPKFLNYLFIILPKFEGFNIYIL